MKDHTRPAFDLFKEILRCTIFLIVGFPLAVLYLFSLFMSALCRTNNPSVSSWSGRNP